MADMVTGRSLVVDDAGVGGHHERPSGDPLSPPGRQHAA
jgi:hypothetical protein